MANTTDFIGAVYDKLVTLLGMTDPGSSTMMQMAWPGFSLTPQDFRRPDAPDGPYDPEVAKETFSHLSNIVPVLNKTRYENSGFEVDDLYELLISGAIPAGATAQTIGANPVNKLFSDAQFELLQARHGSAIDPNGFYHPCIATPSNWYDETAAQFWPALDMKSAEVKPPPPASPFVKAGGVALVNQGVWKMSPTPATSIAIKADVQKAVVTKSVLVAHPPPAGLIKTGTAPLASHGMAAPGPAQGAAVTSPVLARSAMPIDSAVTGTPAFRDNLSAAKTKTLFTQKNVPVSLYTGLAAKVQPIDLTRKKPDLTKVGIADRFIIKDLIDRQLPTKPPSTTDGFCISFKYCRVNIDRTWFKQALLNTKNWYMFGTAAGEYSTGLESNNPGMFPLLTTSFIAIRDLKITANWSQEDRGNIGAATAFGFFDIRDATLNANTLEMKGLQILGWISRLMPQLPPMAPP